MPSKPEDPPARGPTLPTLPGGSTPERGPGAALPHAPTQLSGRDDGPADEPDALEGRVMSGKYRLDRLLGQGGMGAVYAGYHLSLGVEVAVKTMHARLSSSAEYVRRFSREAHALSRLQHPNVVRVIDYGQDGQTGVYFLVMEFLRGEPLGSYLASRAEPPPLDEIGPIFLQVLDGLEAAHREGIVHRDLKPENVFLSRDASGRLSAKVVDFGLAHVDDARDKGPTLTRAEVVAGTPSYMSPEQCQSLAVGPSTDIYALGCLLTAMLQLTPPFGGESSIEIISAQLFLPPPPLRRPPGAEPLPPLLERLRLEMLAKRPELRPADVASVRARFLEATSPEASAERLPPRKGDEPRGGRQDRAPAWTNPEAARPAPSPSAEGPVELSLVRLTQSADGVTSSLVTGLAAQRFLVRERASVAELSAPGPASVLLDAGARLDEAVAALAEIGRLSPRPRVLVCVEGVDIDAMSRLIAAGAADVIAYPLAPDTLGRKVERLLRRKR